jgi:hypothetical protein
MRAVPGDARATKLVVSLENPSTKSRCHFRSQPQQSGTYDGLRKISGKRTSIAFVIAGSVSSVLANSVNESKK